MATLCGLGASSLTGAQRRRLRHKQRTTKKSPRSRSWRVRPELAYCTIRGVPISLLSATHPRPMSGKHWSFARLLATHFWSISAVAGSPPLSRAAAHSTRAERPRFLCRLAWTCARQRGWWALRPGDEPTGDLRLPFSTNEVGAVAERINLFTLVHETAHQLSFNTGMFSRQADVPGVCPKVWQRTSSSGDQVSRMPSAASTGRGWKPCGRLSIGSQLGTFWPTTRAFEGNISNWPMPRLGCSSITCCGPARGNLAFASLSARLRLRTKPSERVKIAEKVLGPLTKLDRELKDEARKYLRESLR